MIGTAHFGREYIANIVLRWLRDASAWQDFGDLTPLMLRNRLVEMISRTRNTGLSAKEQRGVAEALTRWMLDEDGWIKVNWQPDDAASRVVRRVVDQGVEGEGRWTEGEELTDDAICNYPVLHDWVREIAQTMHDKLRESRRFGLRPKHARALLMAEAHQSLLNAV